MRQVFKRSKAVISLLFTIILLFILSGCEGFNFGDVDFGGDIYTQIKEELSVTYSFYEYPDESSSHIDKVYISGKTINSSSFPVYKHEDELLVGWQYYYNSTDTNAKLPSNFYLNKKGYIDSFKVALSPEKLYAVWKTKCTVNFETNQPDIILDPVILPEGDLLPQPQIDYIHGKYRLEGWYLDPDFIYPYDFNQPVTGDFTLYAQWVEYVTITLHRNDGTEENNWNVYSYACPIYSSFNFDWYNAGAREGYGFVGWSSTKDGSVEYYSDDILDNIIEDKDFYAVWTTDIVTITYIDKNGNYQNRHAQYGRGAHVRIGMVLHENEYWYEWLNEAWTIEGKDIAGFSKSSDAEINNLDYDRWGWHQIQDEYGNWNSSNFIVISEDMTLYTYWKDIQYEVIFIYYDNDGNEIWFGNNQYVKWNECIVRPDEVPHVPGKTFENWYRATWMGDGYLIAQTPFDFSTKINSEIFDDKYNRQIIIIAQFTEGGISTGDITSTITFEENQDSDLLLDSVIIDTNTDSITLYAPGSYYDYRWFINGDEKTEYYNLSVITIDTSNWVPGKYDIMLGVSDGAEYYSWQGTLYKN